MYALPSESFLTIIRIIIIIMLIERDHVKRAFPSPAKREREGPITERSEVMGG